ncbi:hypothetical protein WN944_007381 [Citrus x changshan-huyou]|uniref:Uncharacterized protein n=1 Tax=Citrus x changshan-huyou TaxID=2935761 RepID=A0AAP0MQQ4_9ROSI
MSDRETVAQAIEHEEATVAGVLGFTSLPHLRFLQFVG